jgi:two-component system, NtrC family, response regulator
MVESRPGLLIVEDDPGLQKQLRWCFDEYRVAVATDRNEALAQLRRFEPSVVLQDLGLPPRPEGVTEGLRTLQELLAADPHLKVIVVTAHGDRENALKAVGFGAHDFYQKPLDTDVLRMVVNRAFYIHGLEEQNRRLREAALDAPLSGIVATDEAMLGVCRMVEKVAPTDVSVLILGESGTGKELIARAVHQSSARRGARFVAINCAAIPEQLLESELYGYEKGAFTGAIKQSPGKIETANGGTLFLDEIGDMPFALQAKLLRFLQNRTIERIGGREEIAVDLRVVCATNQDLQARIQKQQFREDLFYRISEVTIRLPPLRERHGETVVLANTLLQKFARTQKRNVRGFSDEALAAIQAYGWPGNVRELENKVKSAMIMADGPIIGAADLGIPEAGVTGMGPLNLKEARARAEKQLIQQALNVAGGTLSRAAELLGVSRPTLYDLVSKHGIQIDAPPRESGLTQRDTS